MYILTNMYRLVTQEGTLSLNDTISKKVEKGFKKRMYLNAHSIEKSWSRRDQLPI